MTVAEQVRATQDKDAMLERALNILASAEGKTVQQVLEELGR